MLSDLKSLKSQGLLSNEDISVKRNDHGVIEEVCLITMSTIVDCHVYLLLSLSFSLS